MKQMIELLLDKNYPELVGSLMVFAVLWGLVFIAMAVDLGFGVYRAKKRGIARTSTGLKRTVRKGTQYGAFLTFAFLFDVILSFWFYVPYSTCLSVLFLIFIEGKSVYENFEQKDKASFKEHAEDFIELLDKLRDEDKSQIIDAIRQSMAKTGKPGNQDVSS